MSKTTGLVSPEVFVEEMVSQGYQFDDSRTAVGVLVHPDVPVDTFSFSKDEEIKVVTWVPVRALVHVLKDRGYNVRASAPVYVLEPSDSNESIVVIPSVDELPDLLIRQILRGEPINPDEIIDAATQETGESQSSPFEIDLEAGLRALNTAPHPRHKLDDEALGRIWKILDRVDSEELEETGVTDASENLDKYIY